MVPNQAMRVARLQLVGQCVVSNAAVCRVQAHWAARCAEPTFGKQWEITCCPRRKLIPEHRFWPLLLKHSSGLRVLLRYPELVVGPVKAAKLH